MSEDQNRSAGSVTVRQLARDTSAVIGRVRERKAPMLITRYGLPVAVIQPLDIDPWESRIPAPTVPELEEPPIDWDALALTDAQELLMAELDDRFLNTGDVVFVHLELKGLVETAFGGDCHLTGLGRRVRDALRE